jgi:hypothetical protein
MLHGATPLAGRTMTPVDRTGRAVAVGARVRVLAISPFLKERLPAEDWQALQGMVGDVFEVSQIDEYGWAWVEKWFESDEEGRFCHSLALASDEMEVVP